MKWRADTSHGSRARLHVLHMVETSAQPVMLLHGLGVSGSIWQGFARRLLPRLAAVAPDLRGHGQSSAPSSGYLPADYAQDLVELIEAGDWLQQPVAVVGHSLGALVALALADLRPDLVAWLVLLDPPVDPDVRNPEIAAVYGLRDAAAGQLEAYLLSRNPAGRLLADSLATLFREASDAAFEAFLDREDVRAQALQQAGRIVQPCLVVQADPDRGGVLGDAAAHAFVRCLPRGQLRKIPGATHALHASHPAEVARAILDFYSSAGGSGSR